MHCSVLTGRFVRTVKVCVCVCVLTGRFVRTVKVCVCSNQQGCEDTEVVCVCECECE